MSIATELTRIQTAKADIKSAIEAKGVTVPGSALIDEYDTYIAQISGGGSSDALRDLIEMDITELNIPDGTTKIGKFALYLCRSLTTVTMPDSVTIIDTAAFSGCNSLTSINIPDSVTSIGENAFYQCSSLTSVTIPSSVNSIDIGAFQYCTSLTSVTVESTTPPTLGNNAFNQSNNVVIYVPASAVETYKAASGWSTYASRIEAIPTIIQSTFYVWWPGSEPDPIYLCYSGKQSEFTKMEVDGVVLPNVRNDYTFHTMGEHTVKYTLANPTAIGQQTFLNCNEMTSVTIPNSVTSIGQQAFAYCSTLTSVTVEATTPPTLGSDAFSNNASGRKIYVPSESVSSYQAASGWSTYASDIEAKP